MRNIALRITLCILPLALTPLWAFLISDGYLNFGGGEKDLLLLIPWLIWSVIYMIIFVVSWIKKLSIKKGLTHSAGSSTVILVLIWLVMFAWSFIS